MGNLTQGGLGWMARSMQAAQFLVTVILAGVAQAKPHGMTQESSPGLATPLEAAVDALEVDLRLMLEDDRPWPWSSDPDYLPNHYPQDYETERNDQLGSAITWRDAGSHEEPRLTGPFIFEYMPHDHTPFLDPRFVQFLMQHTGRGRQFKWVIVPDGYGKTRISVIDATLKHAAAAGHYRDQVSAAGMGWLQPDGQGYEVILNNESGHYRPSFQLVVERATEAWTALAAQMPGVSGIRFQEMRDPKAALNF